MRIAVVGAGVSGLVCAYVLSRRYDVTLIESESRLGGHTHTHTVEHEGHTLNVDSGFIVFNERNYPCFSALLQQLGVRSRPTTMSFSVKHEPSGIEYGGLSLSGLFAHRRNLLRPSFYRMLSEILRLGREAQFLNDEVVPSLSPEVGIAQLLRDRGYSEAFLNRYLIPMGAAIWSASQAEARDIPARFFLRFFHNHGMLNLKERPTWRTVIGGSHAYVRAMREMLDRRGVTIVTGDPCTRVTRHPDRVAIHTTSGNLEAEQVVLACHSDQAISLLADVSPLERDILGAIPYQANDAVLHTDASLLPRRRAAWSAWNATVPSTSTADDRVLVTYNMSILQGLQTREPLCVTLNQTSRIDPTKIIATMNYAHPAYNAASLHAQTRHAEISGAPTSGNGRTHFCGAYWGNGFHEDGVSSALRVCRAFGLSLDSTRDAAASDQLQVVGALS